MKKNNLYSIILILCTISISFCNDNKTKEKEKENSEIESASELHPIIIGNQIWADKNLDVSTFANGDPILYAESKEDWENAGKEGRPAWCYANNLKEDNKVYGKLFNWYAVNDKRGLAPLGWYIPTLNDWKQLIEFLGEGNIDDDDLELKFAVRDKAAMKLKSKNGWKAINGNNESGFNALPGGERYENGSFFFEHKASPNQVIGMWWTSSQVTTSNEITDFAYSFGIINEDGIWYWNGPYKSYGLSVRCKKD